MYSRNPRKARNISARNISARNISVFKLSWEHLGRFFYFDRNKKNRLT